MAGRVGGSFPARLAVNILVFLIVLPTNCKHNTVYWVPCFGYTRWTASDRFFYWALSCGAVVRGSGGRAGRLQEEPEPIEWEEVGRQL